MSLSLVRSFGVVGVYGLLSTGLRKFGVPVGGAFDTEALALSNALAFNDAGAPTWELSMAQATFRAERAGVVGVAGALATVVLNGERLPSNSAFSIAEGDEFTVESATEGARVYVAFGDGERPTGWRMRLDSPLDSVVERSVLRVVAGPQSSMFPPDALAGPFTVSRTGNRVGVRLEQSLGAQTVELPSEPQCVGTIQVSNDGTPILIGPDGPTIGGYPKVAVVASCDLPRVGQLRPGDSVRFEPCSIDDARRLATAARDRLAKRIRLLKLISG